MKVQTELLGTSVEAFQEYMKRTGLNRAQATRDLVVRSLERLGYYSPVNTPKPTQQAIPA